MVKRVDSQHKGFEFESRTYRSKNTISEKDSWKPSQKVNFLIKELRALSTESNMLRNRPLFLPRVGAEEE